MCEELTDAIEGLIAKPSPALAGHVLADDAQSSDLSGKHQHARSDKQINSVFAPSHLGESWHGLHNPGSIATRLPCS